MQVFVIYAIHVEVPFATWHWVYDLIKEDGARLWVALHHTNMP